MLMDLFAELMKTELTQAGMCMPVIQNQHRKHWFHLNHWIFIGSPKAGNTLNICFLWN